MELKTILNALFTGLNSHIDRGFKALIDTVNKDRDSKTFEKTVQKQTVELVGIFAEFKKALDKVASPKFDVKVDSGAEKIIAALENIDRKDVVGKAVVDNAKVLEKAFTNLQAGINKLSTPEFKVNIDLKPLESSITALTKQVTKTVERPPITLDAVLKELQLLRASIKENAPEKIGAKIDAMDAVFRGLKPKDSVKFDDKQMQGLMAALTGGRGGMSVGGGVLAARQVTVANVTMTTANTEYSYTFPANTVGFELRLRADDVPLLVSYTTGKLPTSGDGLAYLTVPAYFIEKTAGLDWSGKTIYFQAATASQILEVIIYTA